MRRYVWVMDYPGKSGYSPEIVDADGKTVETLPKQPTREKAVERLREWAKEQDGTVTLMPSGDKL